MREDLIEKAMNSEYGFQHELTAAAIVSLRATAAGAEDAEGEDFSAAIDIGK